VSSRPERGLASIRVWIRHKTGIRNGVSLVYLARCPAPTRPHAPEAGASAADLPQIGTLPSVPSRVLLASLALSTLLIGCRSGAGIQAPGPPQAVVSLPPKSLPVGRLVDAGSIKSYLPLKPLAFSADDLVVLLLQDGSLVAFYTYPPGTSGHVEGCQIHWEANFQAARAIGVSDVWFEPCDGSIWDPSGRRLFGPAPRDLDRFPVSTHAGHVVVDTRRLECQGSPCERVHDLAIVMEVTATAHGFAPETVAIPARHPIDMILKNEAASLKGWHVLSARGANGEDVAIPQEPHGAQYGTIFTIDRLGAYAFQDDDDPQHFHGTLIVRWRLIPRRHTGHSSLTQPRPRRWQSPVGHLADAPLSGRSQSGVGSRRCAGFDNSAATLSGKWREAFRAICWSRRRIARQRVCHPVSAA
jgi:hypothetical protein